MSDELDGLSTFVAVAELKGFRAAGKRLGISHSAVSQAVKRLEERLGVPLVRNGSGVLPNSAQVASGAGALLGISVLTDVHELGSRDAATPYQAGIRPDHAVNILKEGAIYIEVFEAVAPGDALRYFKSGANAGKWGKTASAGNSLALAAGAWEIERGAAAGGLLVLRVNAPAALTFTADT